MDLFENDATGIAALVRSKRVSAVEVATTYLARAERLNGLLGAFILVNQEVINQARKIDEKIGKGIDVGPLAGVPIAIKDLLCTKDIRTTAASKILENFIPPYSATVVDRLEAKGAVLLGKTNLDEFAMGSSTETSAYGVCRNPWNREYVPGGSSGGSAVAVASRMSPLAIGTDTGGSIRQPASYCGVVGLKPTYGRVSRYGIIAYASSLDQAGPMTLTVRDAALALEVIGGADSRDSTCAEIAVPRFNEQTSGDIKGFKIGIPRQFFQSGLNGEIERVVRNAGDLLKEAGAELIEVDLPLTDVAVATYYILATSEASSNLSRYDGVRYGHRADFTKSPAKNLEEFYMRTRSEGFGEEVKRRIILGTYALSSGYYDAFFKKAGQVRRLIRDEFLNVFERCDVILGPVTANLPFKIGEKLSDPLAMYLNDVYTTSANLAGIPGMSVPAGMTEQAFPVGIQLLAPHFQEQRIFNVATAIEAVVGMKGRLPDVIR